MDVIESDPPNTSYRHHTRAQAADACKIANQPQKRRGSVHSPCLTDLILGVESYGVTVICAVLSDG